VALTLIATSRDEPHSEEINFPFIYEVVPRQWRLQFHPYLGIDIRHQEKAVWGLFKIG